jgi:serine phosphatase RsbU (regulator of sigma subunit)
MRPRRITFPILLKLALVTALVLGATTLFLGITWFREAGNHLEDSVLGGLSGLVQARAATLEGIIEQDFERAALVGSRTRLRQCLLQLGGPDSPALRTQILRILSDARSAVEAIRCLEVFAAEGQPIAYVGKAHGGIGSLPPEARGLAAGEFLLGRIQLENGLYLYDVWCPMLDPGGDSRQSIGCLRCRFSAERIFAVVADTGGLGATGEMVLCRAADGEVEIVAPLRNSTYPPLSLSISADDPAGATFLLALSGGEGVAGETTDYNGRKVLSAYAPVKLAGWGLVAKMDSHEALAPTRRLAMWTVKAALLALLLGILVAFTFARFLTRPILELNQAAKAIAKGEFDYRVHVRTHDETGQLGRAFNRMAHRIQTITASRDELNREVEERVAAQVQLTEAMKEVRDLNAQMLDDLQMAREIQQSLMPSSADGYHIRVGKQPNPGLEFAHVYKASWALGGDFFETRPFPGGGAMALICDVMGHGLRAALVAAIIRGLLEDLPREVSRAGEILGFLNEGLLNVLPQQDQLVFVTACCAIVDPATRKVNCAAAGHPSPLLLVPGKPEPTRLYSEMDVAPVLGLDYDTEYRDRTLELEPGSVVVMFTDGVVEVEDAEGDMLGEERFARMALAKLGGAGSLEQSALDALVAEVCAYSGSDEPEDDICLLAVRLDTNEKDD